MWGNGRVEARAVALGIPGLDEQERRDRVPAGTYSKLYDMGQLEIAEGLRVQPSAALWDLIRTAWGKPLVVVFDRFRLAEFEDAVKRGARLEPRVSRWSEAAFDIRALRQMALDGPMAVDAGSQALLATSLSGSMVKSDDQVSLLFIRHYKDWAETNVCRIGQEGQPKLKESVSTSILDDDPSYSLNFGSPLDFGVSPRQ